MQTPTDSESTDIHDVYAHYGLAMYLCQCLERQLILLAPMLTGLHPTRNTRKELDSLWDLLSGKTFGQVLGEFARTVGLPKGFEERLRKAVEARNWLAHRYFSERTVQFVSFEGREQMRTELDEQVSFLSSLDEDLTEIGRAYERSIGASDDKVKAVMSEVIEGANGRLTKRAPVQGHSRAPRIP